MALKDLVAAGDLGAALSSMCQTLNTLNNQYASESAPLAALVAGAGLTSCGAVPNNSTTQAAVAALIASLTQPTAAQWDAATTSRFTTQDQADANTIIQVAAVCTFVLGQLAATLPMNDV